MPAFRRYAPSARMRSRIVRAYLRTIAATGRPIVLGPFRSELGFEVLYWIPFLKWAVEYAGIAPERCLVLSRGGMGHLYPATNRIDLFELRTVDEVRIENAVDAEARKILKQTTVTPWDRALVRDAVTRAYGTGERVHLLHPSWMYWLFAPVWDEHETLRHVATHAEFSPLPVPVLPDGVTLPKKYIAVRFYERFTFPFHQQVQSLVREIMESVTSRYPVVLLNQPLFVDDHTDLPITGPNVHVLPQATPATNLLLQAAVLARSEAFIGTYGGVAQWALRYKKPSLSFYTQFNGTAMAHWTLSRVLAGQVGVPFEVGDIRAQKLWQATLGGVVAPSSSTTVIPMKEVVHAAV